MKALLLLLCMMILGGCTSSVRAADWHIWADQFLAPDDVMVCARTNNGDFAFVAVGVNRVLSGYAIDVTHISGVPRSFTARWQYYNAVGHHVQPTASSNTLERRYLEKEDGRVFALLATSRNVDLPEIDGFNARLYLKKHDTSEQIATVTEEELELFMTCGE